MYQDGMKIPESIAKIRENVWSIYSHANDPDDADHDSFKFAFDAGLALAMERAEKLVKALEFYGKTWNWHNCFREDLGTYVPANTEGSSDVEYDKGKQARAALEDWCKEME